MENPLCASQKFCDSCGLGRCLFEVSSWRGYFQFLPETGPPALLNSLGERRQAASVNSSPALLPKRPLLAVTASLSIEGDLRLSPFGFTSSPPSLQSSWPSQEQTKPYIPSKPEAFLQRQYFWEGSSWHVGVSLRVATLKEVLGVATSFGSEVQLH